jgi:hypothetical protein
MARLSRWSLVSSGILTAAALLMSACTSPAAIPSASSSPATPAVGSSSAAGAAAYQVLIFSGQPGYATIGSPAPSEAAQFAYRRESSCPSGQRVADRGLRLRAQWRYADGIVRLSAVQGSFDDTGDPLAIPFMTMTLRATGVTRNWVTSIIEANHARGYHTTGWVALRYEPKALPAKSALPELSLQVWAADPLTALIYCVATTRLTIQPGSTSGDTAR